MVCANAARIEAAGWNREEIRKSVLDALDDYVRLKPGADSVPPALYVSLTDAVVKPAKRGAFSEWDSIRVLRISTPRRAGIFSSRRA